ncbi:hypothetical protein [Dethiosulfovibrio salsuginis]|uniref:Uncharacterized protein n=1 Tax=Dethiosulfovibrio salsuginis TaxID=561720 RepID=A0A1X7KJW1_9BACT|nr:hypothetical protein [Dethiosulfovibrio salsuginis]SMG40970.1 hypothetical protein SAMN06275492_12846 [Dethiosulfovibrio salsuginis]
MTVVSPILGHTTLLYACPHDPMRQAHAWSERDAEVVIGCLKCPRECPGPDHVVDLNKMDPDGELWEELRGAI